MPMAMKVKNRMKIEKKPMPLSLLTKRIGSKMSRIIKEYTFFQPQSKTFHVLHINWSVWVPKNMM